LGRGKAETTQWRGRAAAGTPGSGREGRRESSGRGGKQRWIYTRGGVAIPRFGGWQSSKGARAARRAGASKRANSLFRKSRFPKTESPT